MLHTIGISQKLANTSIQARKRFKGLRPRGNLMLLKIIDVTAWNCNQWHDNIDRTRLSS